MSAPTARRRRARWVLPEDGIVDELAIEIAAAGIRPVALTPTEQQIAAARILAAGGTPYRISRHLHISGRAAHALAEAITAGSRDDAA
jgi:DNA-binding CsgD family transcriptional regulator